MAERPGKRTDPRKIRQQQAGIMKDVLKRTAPKESLGTRVKNTVASVGAKIEQRRRRSMGIGPMPRLEGSVVSGTKRRRRESA